MLAPAKLVEALRHLPAADAVAARVRAVVRTAFEQRRATLLSGQEVAELAPASLPPLSKEAAQTPFGNVLELLDRGAQTADEWALLSALWSLGVCTPESAMSSGSEMLWLIANTPLSPMPFLDLIGGEEARRAACDALASAAGNALTAPVERQALALALALGRSKEALDAAVSLHDTTADPAVKLILAPAVMARSPLSGDIAFHRSRLGTVALGLSGVLFVVSAWRLFARATLGLRRLGTATLAHNGIGLESSLLLLGKPIRKTERFIPFTELASVQRETRYANASIYAGLFFLALGSYVGVGLFTDGLRAPGGSPSLLALGLAVVAVGVALDFALVRLSSWRSGAARLTLQPHRGRAVVLSGSARDATDAWLHQLTRMIDNR